MKLLHILTASALILALASCTSEVEEAISGQKVPLQITASIERDSRAAGVEDTEFKEGEVIRFCNLDYNNGFWGGEAVYNGTRWETNQNLMLNEKDCILQAIFPDYLEFYDNGLYVRFRAGTNHILSNKEIVNCNQPVAKLQFRHLMARVRFDVTNPEANNLQSITLSGDNIYKEIYCVGNADFDSYDFFEPYVEDITFSNSSTTAGEVQTIDALLVPSSHGDATLTLNYEGGKTYTTTLTLPELKMGDYYRVPITINDDEEESSTDTHEYVDLGLPSGTLWATCNVGANSPEEYGDYFAWGETSPKRYYNRDSYYVRVNKDEGLDLEHDAAYVNWGKNWRMPTFSQIEELCNFDYITIEWTTENGVSGRKVTSKSNGNSIFLPATGCHDAHHSTAKDDFYDAGISGHYWSRTLDPNTLDIAPYLYISSVSFHTGSYYPYCGYSVRPVRQK